MISTVISYCSLDAKFIEANILECRKFSNDIWIIYFDHLLNGKIEDEYTLKLILNKYKEVKALKIEFDPNKDSKYHHNLARWIGQYYSKNEWVLFLDADEIPDGYQMAKKIDDLTNNNNICVFFNCYWYFRNPCYQSTVTEECGLLINKKKITHNLIFSDKERWQAKFNSDISHRIVKEPIIHHFSWVRTKDEMLEKTSAWAHKNERNWSELIDKEFQQRFNGTDFIHGYSYIKVPNFFNIDI